MTVVMLQEKTESSMRPGFATVYSRSALPLIRNRTLERGVADQRRCGKQGCFGGA